MASLKDIKTRITSVRSTQKITSAMRMIASAKLRRTQSRALHIEQYRAALRKTVDDMLATGGSLHSPLSEQRPVRHVTLVAIASSSGLCGAFNTNVWNAAKARMEALREQGVAVTVVPIGKKMAYELDKLQLPYPGEDILLADQFTQNPTPATQQAVRQLADRLKTAFTDSRTDCVEIIHTHSRSMGSIHVTCQQLLPLTPEAAGTAAGNEFIIEPDAGTFCQTVSDRLLLVTLMTAMMDSATSEHASRMIAMQTADDNAQDLLQQLTLLYNKTRQQGITNELIDLMSGRMSQ